MALDDNRISFGVDVSTGQSEESINKVIDRIDGLKDKINELKKLRTKNKKDADIFANYTKSIRDTERELSKLQSTYNSWIQKATNVDAKPIGDVKKQAQEFIALLKQWDGQATSFQKQVMSHFMIPNSAVDQLKLYKNIMGELQGYGNKKIIDTGNVETALKQLVTMAKDAQQAVDKLKNSLKDTNVGGTGRLAEEEEKLSRIRQQLNGWDGKGSFSSSISGFENLDSYSRQIQALRRAYEELNTVKGKNSIDDAKVESAIDSVKSKYDELVAKKNQVDAELKKGTEDVAKASKKAADDESANVKKTIGDVKKQTPEFISLLKQWDGQSATFQKQVMSHFMIPNSAVDQLRLYKNIMQEIEGIQSKNTIKNFPAYKALQQLTDMAQVAQKSVERLNATLSNTALGAYHRWNGKGSFANTLPGYGDYSSLSKRRRQVKSAYDELVGYFGADAKYIPTAQSALKQLEEEYQKLTRMAKEAKEALNGTQTDTSKIDKQKQSTEQLAEAEQKLSRIRQQLKDWDGKGSFSSTISGFDNLDSYSRQIQALRRAYEELNAVKGKKGIDNVQVESAIDSVKRKYDELVAKKNQVDAELKKGTEDVAKASKKAADDESANVKKTIDEYTRLKLRMAEIQEQIKNNYVTNFKTSPALYNTNFARLSAEYKEVAEAVNQADRNMARFATKADFAGRAMDRLYQRSAWFFSAIGANAIIAVPNAWYDAQTKIENSMAQFAQVMATDAHAVNAFQTSLFDINFSQLEKGFDANAARSQKFINDLNYMKSSLMNFAVKYGEASEDVIKSATLWGRKYKDNQTVLTMTDAAMKLAVADSFSIVEANKNLESSLVQWGFEIKNNNDAMIVSSKIIDSWTALAHKMALSAQDLSAANQRAAQSMRAVGLSFDEGQALIATMLANTQQAGGEIGNAIKSIMGSIHSKKAIEDIENMGVAVYKFSEDGKKEFREVGQVLVDLMIKTQNTDKNLESLLKNMAGGKIAICPSLK